MGMVHRGFKPAAPLEDAVAAGAAIAAAGPAELDILLAAERHAAVAADAGADIDFCLVKEFHGSIGKLLASMRQPLARANIATSQYFSGLLRRGLAADAKLLQSCQLQFEALVDQGAAQRHHAGGAVGR